jgi:hypothetical protein
VGGDFSVFFSRHIGVGAVVRGNRGTVTVAEPLTGTDGALRVGHVEVGGGLRVRF